MGGDLMVTQSKSREAFETLKLERGAWLIKQIAIEKWGMEVIITGVYDPFSEADTDFRLIFQNCTRVQWSVETDEFDDGQLEADVIGFDLYEEKHEASFTTDLFTLIVTYGELILDKNW